MISKGERSIRAFTAIVSRVQISIAAQPKVRRGR